MTVHSSIRELIHETLYELYYDDAITRVHTQILEELSLPFGICVMPSEAID